MKTLEAKAGSVEDAISKGLNELNKTREEVDVEIIETGGFLKKAKVILTVKPTEGEKALDFIQQLLKKMNLNVSVELKEDTEKAELILSGEDSGNVIGYRGDVLDSLQYITSVVINKGKENYKKIIVDCENYRSRRTETLISLAGKLAEKAISKGRKISLEPMNPFERRIIHSALQENDQVTTKSEGIEPNRYIVITPKVMKPYTEYNDDKSSFNRERPYNNRERSTNKDSGLKSGYGGAGRQGGVDKPQGGYGDTQTKKSSFNTYGTYLGNSKSGFTVDTDFTKKSSFDNLKD